MFATAGATYGDEYPTYLNPEGGCFVSLIQYNPFRINALGDCLPPIAPYQSRIGGY